MKRNINNYFSITRCVIIRVCRDEPIVVQKRMFRALLSQLMCMTRIAWNVEVMSLNCQLWCNEWQQIIKIINRHDWVEKLRSNCDGVRSENLCCLGHDWLTLLFWNSHTNYTPTAPTHSIGCVDDHLFVVSPFVNKFCKIEWCVAGWIAFLGWQIWLTGWHFFGLLVEFFCFQRLVSWVYVIISVLQHNMNFLEVFFVWTWRHGEGNGPKGKKTTWKKERKGINNGDNVTFFTQISHKGDSVNKP